MRIIARMARDPRPANGASTDHPVAITAPGEVVAVEPVLVPSRRQYLDLKRLHPDAVLLYRLGDFYETFDDDAALVAQIARITLTSRSFGRSGRVPMAGIPHHALNHYLGRLLAAGLSVAIAEQVSAPGIGLVDRAVTRVLTPGTIAEPTLLPAGENRYLAAVHLLRERVGLAWVDVSTGEFAVREFSGEGAAAEAVEELSRLSPAECLLPDDDAAQLPDDLGFPGHRTRLERWHFEPGRAAGALCRRFGVGSLAPYGCADLAAATGAAGAIVAYLERTNPALLPMLTGLRTEAAGRTVGLDAATRRNLELTRSFGTGGSRGSLLGVVDRTRTAMGARTLRRLLTQPLQDIEELRRRQALVGALAANSSRRSAITAALAPTGDLERLVGRVAQNQAGPREFLALLTALRRVPTIAADLAHLSPPATALTGLPEQVTPLDPCPDLRALIERAIAPDGGGGASLRPGFWPALDAVIEGAAETRRFLATLERDERERTGIRSLKVGFNRVFGYYIEVTRPNLAAVPAEYRRKQTVATGERFVTVPLKEAEATLLAADEAIAAHEREALAALHTSVLPYAARLTRTAVALAYLDSFVSLAEVAAHHEWVAPDLTAAADLLIEGGRHPVVEASLAGEAFIPNDCLLGGDGPRQLIVTGPNMGGKSTFLRQTALIVLLAQIGSFVPAATARVGLVDRIFTRVGAQDDLARGHSTFMVEMVETATILHQATARSLLVLDEVGRGTSTEDGVAIARAVLEDINGRIGARTLFATHFLELTTLADHLPGIANAHVAALEREGRVVFLYAVCAGPADRAYGVHVARLAGLPPWVADRAEAILNQRPDGTAPEVSPRPDARTLATAPAPLSFPPEGEQAPAAPVRRVAEGMDTPYWPNAEVRSPATVPVGPVVSDLRQLDLDGMTPKQALDWLFAQRQRLDEA